MRCFVSGVKNRTLLKISVFKDLIPVFQIRVKPNDNNKIYITANDKKKTDDSDMQPTRYFSCFSCLGKCSQMDSKVMKLAFNVLEKVKMEKYENTESDLLKNRIIHIEKTLDDITNKLNTLLNTKK